MMPQHASVMLRVCRPEKTMNDPTKKPANPSAEQTRQIEPPEDDERPTRPTRPPRVADFIIDRDKTDPLRRFRF
jgi:hypothetical protein